MSSEQGTDQPEQPAEPARERPRWSAAEAARRCGVGRATIQRALAAGRIPGAEQTDAGWSIPLEGLLAAGFKPDRYQPHDPQQHTPAAPAREHDRAADHPVSEQARRLADLEAELAEARSQAALERVRREAAEALAAERAERVTDLQQALRMIEAAPADRPQPEQPAPVPEPVQQPAPAAPTPAPRRGLFRWLR